MKRFTVEVEGHLYDGATYRILAKTEKEALKKAKERFEKESIYYLDMFDTIEVKIKTNKKGEK